MTTSKLKPIIKLLLAIFPCYLPVVAEENIPVPLHIETIAEPDPPEPEEGITVDFTNVPVQEFIRFVSKTSNVNFIYDHKDLCFNITLSSGRPVSSGHILKALIQILLARGLFVMDQDGYYVIHKSDLMQARHEALQAPLPGDQLSASHDFFWMHPDKEQREFMVYKLQYQQGSEIEAAIKKIGADLHAQPDAPNKLVQATQSLQWVKATNSLLASGDGDSLASLRKLIESIDVPLKQVFIEVLVIETDIHHSMDFGLEWAAGGVWNQRLGFGLGNFAPSAKPPTPFASAMQGLSPGNPPSGFNQIPISNGFDLGVIGNMILHKGKAFLSLGSLVSALQLDGDSTIVLNQKIITQDNKNSKIFVGDNLPFAGSVVQTIGASQQTTANIEYRDIGVSLSITPMLGEGDVISLDIKQEITEAIGGIADVIPINDVSGIRTTKTDMSTQVHVPDQHFLILTGMIRNHRTHRKAGLPCLGGLPLIGAAFSKNVRKDEKKNVIVFVRPQIVRSFEEYRMITQNQEDLYRKESLPANFDRGLELITPLEGQ